jgi:hypothetical protein
MQFHDFIYQYYEYLTRLNILNITFIMIIYNNTHSYNIIIGGSLLSYSNN